MANETTTSSLTTAGSRLATVLGAAVEGMLERVLHDPTNLGDYAVMIPYVGGGNANKIHRKPAPIAFSSASSETSGGASNTAYTPVSFSLTPVRKYAKIQATDLAILTDPVTQDPRDPRFTELVADIVAVLVDGIKLTITDVLAALFTGLTGTTVGTSGAALTVDDIFDAQFGLNLANVQFGPGKPAICVLAPRQMNHFRDSLRGESGVMAWQQPSAEMLKVAGSGLQGEWNNIWFVQSDSCVTSDAAVNVNGAMFSRDCFAYQFASIRAALASIPAQNVLLATELFFLELGRDPDNGMTTFYGNIYLGAAEAGEDSRGVRIRSSAT